MCHQDPSPLSEKFPLATCDPKSFRTITLSPVLLKWMERVILWHMEADLKVYDKLSKKQYGFKRGSSTTAAIHKLVRKLEMAMLNKGMALGTFLDIEGAFDNVSFDSIEKALSKTPRTVSRLVSTGGSCQ